MDLEDTLIFFIYVAALQAQKLMRGHAARRPPHWDRDVVSVREYLAVRGMAL